MNNLSDKKVSLILLHEIYGINEHMKTVAAEYSKKGCEVICPDLLRLGKPFDYSCQQEAYRYFIDNIGFERPVSEVKQLATEAKKTYKHVILAGYSIGATIAWLCSGEAGICDGVICYYGSRIRDFMAIDPKCPTLLFFPSHEKSFDVLSFAGTFKKSNTEVHILNGEHGFADPFCVNFCKASYLQSVEIVNGFMKNILLNM
jgi:dienelactone hydrolase